MNHLSGDQISQYLLGDLPPDQVAHAEGCPHCRARLDLLESSLSHFRSSVRNLEETNHMTRMYTGNETMAGLTSLLIHSGVVALLLLLGTLKPVQTFIHESVTPLIAPSLKPREAVERGGGGGGARSPIDASKGKLPPMAHKQFTPPRVDAADSKLPMTPSIIADAPTINATSYGDPLGKVGIPSNGTGFGGGIGSGSGGAVGSGKGVGVGPGDGGGFGGGVFRIGGGVSSPAIIKQVEPEYSEDARKAKWQGTVELSVIVDETGHARNITVSKSLGMGLDQKAMEAVEKWLFKPGMRNGKPVAVFATIQVTFHLL